jgi:DNA-binding response OmpR family regulator
MKARILWIEGKRANSPSFVPSLRKREHDVQIVETGKAGLAALPDFDPDLVVVHAASLRSNGKRICNNLRHLDERMPIVLILDEGVPTPETSANVILKLPFTSRKLLNRVIPLLPADEEQILHVGPIRLYTDMKKVRCQGRESRLTPRLTKLLKTLMANPGVVQEREALFREVWNTQYTGDTRTLDVHISWLRQAIEENPRKPKFLKTIRGVGYRLDV